MTPTNSNDSLSASATGFAASENDARSQQVFTNGAHAYQAAQVKMQDGVSRAMKYWQESMAFGQDHMAALMQSSKIMTAGLQEITRHVAETGKANIDQSIAFTKSIAGAKSVKEALEIQADYVKNTLETSVAQSRELAEAATALSKHASQPLAKRAALSGKLPTKK